MTRYLSPKQSFHLSSRFLLLAALLLLFFTLNGCGGKTRATRPTQEQQLSPASMSWHQMMKQYRNAPEQVKLRETNNFFNKLEYVEDAFLWGKKDYWATPYEMLEKGGGDCEDFAIAKYLTLKHLGIAEEKLRITYVIAVQRDNTSHMVLTYYQYPSAVPLVLDSLQTTILPATRRPDLLPVFSFNASELWLNQQSKAVKLRSAEGLSLWQQVLQRFHAEAIASPLP